MLQTTIGLVIFLFPLAYSPGPGNSLFASLGAASGFHAAIPALLGYHVATFIVTSAIGLSAGFLVLANPHVAVVLRMLGSGYVIWLGGRSIWAALQSNADGAMLRDPAHANFCDGAILLLLNPKAYLIIGLMFTQFLRPGAGWIDVVAITAIFTINNFLAFAVWTLLGAAIAKLLQTTSSRTATDIFFAICLIGVGVWMLFN